MPDTIDELSEYACHKLLSDWDMPASKHSTLKQLQNGVRHGLETSEIPEWAIKAAAGDDDDHRLHVALRVSRDLKREYDNISALKKTADETIAAQNRALAASFVREREKDARIKELEDRLAHI